ncbi:Proteasome subunit beta type-4 [Bienertia sinuspersici]
MDVQSPLVVDDIQRTQYPYVTGTSIIGIKFKDGVLIAADMGVGGWEAGGELQKTLELVLCNESSYGSTLRYKSVERLKGIGKHSLLGASGEISDFQELLRTLDDLILYDNMWDDGNSFGPKEVHSYLTRVMYNRRNKFNPLWNSLVLGGVKNGQKYLGTVNMIGVHYQDNYVATGFGNHLAIPILRDGWREDLSFEEGVKLLEQCMRVLLYRDRSAINKHQIAKITEEGGVTISPPYSLKTYWEFSAFQNPSAGAQGSCSLFSANNITHSKMETNTPLVSGSKTRRPQSGGIPRSPRLSRSNSGTSTASLSETRGTSPHRPSSRASVSLPEIRALASTSPQPSLNRSSRSATTSPRPSVHRSRSTSKSRSSSKEEREDESYNNIPISKALGSPRRRLSLDSKDDQSTMAKLLRSSSQNLLTKGVGKSLTKSPSAWALSPGRPLPGPPLAPDSPKVKGVSGVLKYFNKQKKVSSAQEEEFHQYKVMHNRLLQWRFVNAKAEAGMAKVKRKAEEKVFGVWLKLYKMRYAIAEKRMKVVRLKQKVKFLEILCPQIELLNEWEKLEKKNGEAVARVTRKLSAYSTKLPLVDAAMADISSVLDAMKLAMEVMENVEETIMDLHSQVEIVSNMVRELMHIVKQNMECFQELEKEIATVMSLEV